MIHLGLTGFPLGHSLSPTIHKAALEACRLEGSYSLFEVRPEDHPGLNELLGRIRAGEITGLNVTIPHKQNVIPMLDALTPTAQAVGAVNTIHLEKNNVVGHNTDVQGFLLDLKRLIGDQESGWQGRKSALVLGAGGSARSVTYGLLNDGWQVTVAARRIEQAREMAARFIQVEVMEIGTWSLLPADLGLVVNATPVGMLPEVDRSPWPMDSSLPNTMIYDLVYNPRETKLVRDARQAGLYAETGLGMLIEQASLAFEIWTGHRPPREILFQAVNLAATE